MSKFVFDLNKCVGCHACVVACSLENGTEPSHNFREVHQSNFLKIPGIPIFNLSLACNHCTEASCVKNCPTTALTRDAITGAVWVDHTKCIGCQYCVWSCPFDVPKFNHSLRMVEKCNWCKPRLEKQELPNCVNLCPTGALAFELEGEHSDFEGVEGFPKTEIKPNIQFIDFRFKQEKENETLSAEAKNFIKEEVRKELPNKISAKKEWPLLLFTLLFSVVSGMKFSEILGLSSLNTVLFYLLISIAGISSLWHLGRKERAFRAITNLKTSWLSREIFFFGAFVGVSVVSTVFHLFVFDVLAGIFALLTLLSIEKIYSVAQPNALKLHSANVFLSAALFLFVFSNQFLYVVLLFIVKIGLYLHRKFKLMQQNRLSTLTYLRILLVVIALYLPLILRINLYSYPIFIVFLMSELIDRVEFYNELNIKSPSFALSKSVNLV